MRKRICFFAGSLLILTAVMSAFILADKKKDDAADTGRVMLIKNDKADIVNMTFTYNGDSFTLKNSNGSWILEDSGKPDGNMIEEYSRQVINMDGKLIEQDCQDKAKYGISESAHTINIEYDDRTSRSFILGNKTPPGTEYYISDDDNNIYTIYTAEGSAVAIEKYQVEDNFIFGVNYEHLSRITVNSQNGFELSKDQSNWTINKNGVSETIPTDKVRMHVTKSFGGMYAQKTYGVNDERNEKYGFNEVNTYVTVTDTEGNVNTFILGAETDDGRYIKFNGNNEIYLVTKDYFSFVNSYEEGNY